MEDLITELRTYTKGLLFISESESPFVVTSFKNKIVFENFLKLSGKIKIEIQDLDYFFRNMVIIRKEYSEEEIASAQKFISLVKFLKDNLKHIEVYRLGEKKVNALIVGETKESVYVVLSTELIET